MKQQTVHAGETPAEARRSSRWLSGTMVYSFLFLCLFLLLYLVPSMVVLIPAGHSGVLYRPLQGGTFMEGAVAEGLALVSPVNSMTVYDTRLQEREETVDVLSSNGLTIVVSVSFRFAPLRGELPSLHTLIGPDYDRKMVVPTVISSVREMVGKYLPEELYTTHRNTVQEEMNRDIRSRLAGKHIHFETVLIRSIRLPEVINDAIENKLRQQQEFQEYEYRLKRERQEAERKRIEAEGLRDFQAMVNENLTPGYLRWKWIDSMLSLSKSENAKVVVLGEGKEGDMPVSLPLFMDAAPQAPSSPAEAPENAAGGGPPEQGAPAADARPAAPESAPPGQ